jgi:aminoglycoside/choline kinase family phosphotransferase
VALATLLGEPEFVADFLARALPGEGPFAVALLAGGASPRRFYRVTFGASSRAVVMVVPETTPDVVKARELRRRWPFLEIRDLLESRGVRVPKLLSEDVERGLLLVEDLGSTLAERLVEAPGEREQLYLQAVRDLCAAQRSLAELDADCIVRLRAFDYELLHWEIQHFREWGVEARGVTLTSEQRDLFDRAASHLAHVIEALPRGFVHRDYQSRNLMVTHGEKKLAWIDFQDALLGPRAYDLVALLCDSYQPFVREFVERCLDEYARAAELTPKDRLALGREFDLITVQRKLKDAGRFVFIERNKGDASFLPFIEPTLDMVRQALGRLRDDPLLAELEQWLARNAEAPA